MTELVPELPRQRLLEAFRERASPVRFAGSLVCLVIGAVYLVPLAWVVTEAIKASSGTDTLQGTSVYFHPSLSKS